MDSHSLCGRKTPFKLILQKDKNPRSRTHTHTYIHSGLHFADALSKQNVFAEFSRRSIGGDCLVTLSPSATFSISKSRCLANAEFVPADSAPRHPPTLAIHDRLIAYKHTTFPPEPFFYGFSQSESNLL